MRDLFFVLGSEPRLKLLKLLIEKGEMDVNTAAEAAGLPQSTASSHLRLLLQAGALSVRSEVNRRVYSAAPGVDRLLEEAERIKAG